MDNKLGVSGLKVSSPFKTEQFSDALFVKLWLEKSNASSVDFLCSAHAHSSVSLFSTCSELKIHSLRAEYCRDHKSYWSFSREKDQVSPFSRLFGSKSVLKTVETSRVWPLLVAYSDKREI